MKKSVHVITACLQTYRQRGNTWIAHFKCSLLKILVLYLLENLHFEHLNAFLRFLSKFILKHNECGQAILAQSGWCFFELWRVWACQWCRLFHMTAIALCERSVGCCALKPPAHAITLLVVEDSSLNHTWLQYFNLKRSLSNPNFFIACLSSTLESALLLLRRLLNKKNWFTVSDIQVFQAEINLVMSRRQVPSPFIYSSLRSPKIKHLFCLLRCSYWGESLFWIIRRICCKFLNV